MGRENHALSNAGHKSRGRLSQRSQAVGNVASLTSGATCLHWGVARSEDPKTDAFQGLVSHRWVAETGGKMSGFIQTGK